MNEQRKRHNRRRRPRGVKPVPLPRRSDAPFAAELLKEFPDLDEDLGVSLWLAVRFTVVWSSMPEAERWRISVRFESEGWDRTTRAADQHPDIADALTTLRQFRRRTSSVARDKVALACATIRSWAEDHGHVETAVHFAEAAAYVEPNRAVRANEAGAACRRAGLFDRAAMWLIRARGLALRANDKDQKLRSLLALGALFKETGRQDKAEAAFLAACRAASRRNQRGRTAEAHHDLMLLFAEQGRLSEATDHAEFAADMYPLKHKRLPYLAHDFAFVLLRNGLYSTSFTLLDSFVRTIPAAHVLPALSTFAWAAAGSGQAHRYEEAEGSVLRMLAVKPAHEHAPACFIHLAEGARLLSRWDRAEQHLWNAVSAAESRGDPTLEAEARDLIEAVRRRHAPALVPAAPDRRLSILTRHFKARLRAWKAPPDQRGQEPPVQVRKRA